MSVQNERKLHNLFVICNTNLKQVTKNAQPLLLQDLYAPSVNPMQLLTHSTASISKFQRSYIDITCVAKDEISAAISTHGPTKCDHSCV